VPRQRLKDVAFDLFSKGDYNSVSLANIAERAGIKKPSIYAHFSSKEELFLEVLDNELQGLFSHIDEKLEKIKSHKTDVMLYECLKTFIEYAANNPKSGRFWSHILYSPPLNLIDQVGIRTVSFDEKLINIQSEILRNGIKNCEIKEESLEKLIYSFNSLIKGNFAMVVREQSYSLEKLNFCWQIYWNGIKY
jgi:AcrR family transcriptional regulator